MRQSMLAVGPRSGLVPPLVVREGRVERQTGMRGGLESGSRGGGRTYLGAEVGEWAEKQRM